MSDRSAICRSWTVWAASLVAALVFFMISAGGHADQEQVDAKKKGLPHVLSPAPRELRQRLRRAEEAIAEARFSDAAEAMGKLFEAVAATDYFVTDQDSKLARGFRSELRRVMRDLPQPAREVYEELFGVEARQELEDAIQQQSLTALHGVAHRWSFTWAGDQASLLLGRLDLDQGRSDVAVARLRQLGAAWDAEHLEPERSILLARGLLRLSQRDRAIATLDALRKTHPDSSIYVNGQTIPLFADGADPLKLIAANTPKQVTSLDDWLLFRGDAAGLAMRPNTVDPAKQLWRQSTDAAALARQQQQLAERDLVGLPVLSPLVIDQQIVIRTSQGIAGVNAQTGETIWRYPPTSLLVTVEPEVKAEKNDGREQAADDTITTGRRQRVWSDASYGRMSSDGKRVYFVDNLSFAGDPLELAKMRQMAIWGQQPSRTTPKHSQLVAIDADREGAFAWMVGDETGEGEPELAGTYFLGPPLPVGGALYILGEKGNAISLHVLAADSGRLSWSIKLAQVDQQSISQIPTRRFVGATPAYTDGVLVCPTSAGAVAAVDLASRSLLWGFQHHQPPSRSADQQQWVAALGYAPQQVASGWADPGVSIAGGSVLITIGSDHLYCVDLQTGKEQWTRRRSDALYAAVIGETILLVGTHRFAALRLADGKPAWKTPFVAIPGGGIASGRGLAAGGFYYLPTTDPELLKIDLTAGTIVNRQLLDAPLGNLCAMPARIMSQSAAHVSAFGAADMALVKPMADKLATDRKLTAEPIATLVRKLADDRFGVREAATAALLKRIDEALPDLNSAVRSDDPEVAQRTVLLLVKLLDSKDGDVAFGAREILRMAALTAAPNAICANAFLRESRRREPLARKQLQELGATVKADGKTVSLRSTWKGGNDGLTHLRWLPKIVSAEIRHSKIDDDGLRHLRGIATLQTVNLNRTKITSAGLAHLTGLPHLKTLLLQGTQVGDDAIEHLRRLPKLRAINLSGTRFTESGVEQVKGALPELKVTY